MQILGRFDLLMNNFDDFVPKETINEWFGTTGVPKEIFTVSDLFIIIENFWKLHTIDGK